LPFELIESSCCGMAGAAIIGNSFSCRLQIEKGGVRQPIYLAKLLSAGQLPEDLGKALIRARSNPGRAWRGSFKG
jgi:hypothetical protein